MGERRRRQARADRVNAVTLTQPWATLVAVGRKHIETRSWRPNHRVAHLAIHAAKGWTKSDQGLARAWGFDPAQLPRGAIVAVCGVESYEATERVHPDGLEGAYGDYSPGRWAWHLRDVRRLVVPIPCSGALSLWTVPPDVEEAIRMELEAVTGVSPT